MPPPPPPLPLCTRAGCILLALLSGIAPFPARTETEQLRNLISVLGTPSPDSYLRSLPGWAALGAELEDRKPRLKEYLATRIGSPELKELLVRLLEGDPRKRLKASEALKAPWFAAEPRIVRDDPTMVHASVSGASIVGASPPPAPTAEQGSGAAQPPKPAAARRLKLLAVKDNPTFVRNVDHHEFTARERRKGGAAKQPAAALAAAPAAGVGPMGAGPPLSEDALRAAQLQLQQQQQQQQPSHPHQHMAPMLHQHQQLAPGGGMEFTAYMPQPHPSMMMMMAGGMMPAHHLAHQQQQLLGMGGGYAGGMHPMPHPMSQQQQQQQQLQLQPHMQPPQFVPPPPPPPPPPQLPPLPPAHLPAHPPDAEFFKNCRGLWDLAPQMYEQVCIGGPDEPRVSDGASLQLAVQRRHAKARNYLEQQVLEALKLVRATAAATASATAAEPSAGHWDREMSRAQAAELERLAALLRRVLDAPDACFSMADAELRALFVVPDRGLGPAGERALPVGGGGGDGHRGAPPGPPQQQQQPPHAMAGGMLYHPQPVAFGAQQQQQQLPPGKRPRFEHPPHLPHQQQPPHQPPQYGGGGGGYHHFGGGGGGGGGAPLPPGGPPPQAGGGGGGGPAAWGGPGGPAGGPPQHGSLPQPPPAGYGGPRW